MIMRQDFESSNFKSVESAHGGSQSFPKLMETQAPAFCKPASWSSSAVLLASQHVHVLSIRTSWPVSVVWVTLSTLVAIMSLVSLVQPEWLVRERTDTPRPPLTYDPDDLEYMLGLYGACYRDAQENGPVLVPGDALCYRFREDDASPFQREEASAGEGVDPRFPSRTWHASFLLFSFGSAVLCIAAVLAILSLAMEGTSNRKAAAAVIGHAQGAGVVLQAWALILFPWFLATPFAQDHCANEAAAFSLGHCRLGWASALALVSTLLGIYCPLLVRFATYKVYAPCPWDVL